MINLKKVYTINDCVRDIDKKRRKVSRIKYKNEDILFMLSSNHSDSFRFAFKRITMLEDLSLESDLYYR